MAMAPHSSAAHTATGYSGRLRMQMATRSPGRDAERLLQLAGQAQGPVADVGEGVALVLVDHVDQVGVALAHGEHVEHRPRRPHEVPEGEAVDHDRLDLEGPARADERLQARLVGVDGRDPGRVVDGHRVCPPACTA